MSLADSTLMGMSKKEIIEHLRCLEHSYMVLKTAYCNAVNENKCNHCILIKKLKEQEKQIVAKENSTDWKSIKLYGKPKKNGEYLVTRKGGRVDMFGFTTNPYRLDPYDFRDYKGRKTDGIFYNYDSEYGYSDYPDEQVVAWCEVPKAYKGDWT